MSLWTEDEDRFVLATPHLTTAEVGQRLNRSLSAVRSRRAMLAKRIGITFRQNNDPHKPGKRPLLARTCLHCGLLLRAEWFGLDKGGWRSTCTRCRQAMSPQPNRSRGIDSNKRSTERLQAISLPHAVNHRQPWMERDHAVLADPDLLLIEKAIRLGRTYMATATACSDGGYPSKVGLGDDGKGQWYIDNPNERAV